MEFLGNMSIHRMQQVGKCRDVLVSKRHDAFLSVSRAMVSMVVRERFARSIVFDIDSMDAKMRAQHVRPP
jgi:hypothetical protein